MKRIKASDFIADELHRQGVTVIFEMIGGMITHIIDSLHQKGQIQILSMHHEQAAGFAAEAVARMRGVPGVALATSGPGATNLVTAIGSCYFDSVPTVFITGQVNTSELSNGRALRQQGFQETDIVSIVKPITKAAWQLQNAEDLPQMMRDAFKLASEGRCGPVLLDLPMDLQRAEIEDEPQPVLAHTASTVVDHVANFSSEVAKAISEAQRPLIIAGGGIRSANVHAEFTRMVNRMQVPVALSLLGVDLLPYEHPLRVGMIGTYGNRWANDVLMESDVILVVGSRLDVRQTGADAVSFKGSRPIYHIDCDPEELNNRVVDCRTCQADLADFIPVITELYPNGATANHHSWLKRISELRAKCPDVDELKNCKGINPNLFMHSLSHHSTKASAFVADVGKNQMWAAQSIEIQSGQRLLFSGGMGSMGFALPAAIGAVFESNNPVVCITGDGGLQCNIQELETIAFHRLPVKVVVLNNLSLGMVGQFQEDYFESRMQSTVWGYSAPNFEHLAKAYGIDAMTLATNDQTEEGLEWLWSNPNSPALLNVMIDVDTKVYPKAAYGRPINDMDPKRS